MVPDPSKVASTRHRSSATAAVIALILGLLVIWIDVYFHLGPADEQSVGYQVGRYSLLLAFVAFVTMIVERIRGHVPVAALGCLAVAYVGVLLGRVLQTGGQAYPWVIAAAAVIAGGVALSSPRLRGPALRTCVALAVASGMGLLGLA